MQEKVEVHFRTKWGTITVDFPCGMTWDERGEALKGMLEMHFSEATLVDSVD